MPDRIRGSCQQLNGRSSSRSSCAVHTGKNGESWPSRCWVAVSGATLGCWRLLHLRCNCGLACLRLGRRHLHLSLTLLRSCPPGFRSSSLLGPAPAPLALPLGRCCRRGGGAGDTVAAGRLPLVAYCACTLHSPTTTFARSPRTPSPSCLHGRALQEQRRTQDCHSQGGPCAPLETPKHPDCMLATCTSAALVHTHEQTCKPAILPQSTCRSVHASLRQADAESSPPPPERILRAGVRPDTSARMQLPRTSTPCHWPGAGLGRWRATAAARSSTREAAAGGRSDRSGQLSAGQPMGSVDGQPSAIRRGTACIAAAVGAHQTAGAPPTHLLVLELCQPAVLATVHVQEHARVAAAGGGREQRGAMWREAARSRVALLDRGGAAPARHSWPKLAACL